MPKDIKERMIIITRRKVTLDEVRKVTGNYNASDGICALVDVENMGWCNDFVTRWYIFNLDGEPCIYFKY